MIGDWVRANDPNGPFVSRVYGLSLEPSAIYAKEPDLTVAYPYDEDCVDPIPLTPEILEKNGFIKSERYEVWKIISDDYELRITPWRVSVIFLDEDGTDKEEFSAPRPKYVNEIQRVLRICGIEKGINVN